MRDCICFNEQILKGTFGMFVRSTNAVFQSEFGDGARAARADGDGKALAAALDSTEPKPQFADIPGSTATTATIGIGGSVTDSLEVVGDSDWFRISLDAGDSIAILLEASGASPLADPFLRIRDSAGNILATNDDGATTGLDSLLNFVADSGGTYYIEVTSYDGDDVGSAGDYSGGYTLSVSEREPIPLFTYDQIADQLTEGYWGGSPRRFNVDGDGRLTVNISALTAEGQFFALQALNLWSDITGIEFVAIGEPGDFANIVFDDDEEGAFATSSVSGGFIVTSNVNVSTDWIASDGTDLNSYSFQTYIHEIGHALGLGHAGNYNGDANYGVDALYQNDSWATTVMSYFSQGENSYFSAQGFDTAYITSPMNGDVVAMTALYGLSTTTRTGNTIYGFNSNAGRDIFDATQFANTAYTIVDSAGIDTLDYSGFTADQRIDLNQETFSDIGGLIGNVVIARGTVIERAIGGSGIDTIVGNAERNRIEGGEGGDFLYGNDDRDTLYGEGGGDWMEGGDAADWLYGGDANDIMIGGDRGDMVVGDAGNDTLQGNGSSDTLYGGLGADKLSGHGGRDNLFGEAGDDRLYGSTGTDTLNGGADNDLLSGGSKGDFFQFDLFGSADADEIEDFQAGLDMITLDRATFTGISADGVLATSAFRAGSNATDSSDRIIYNQATGEIFYDSDGNGAAAKQLFATVAAGTVLANTDFSAFTSASAMTVPELDKPAADLAGADQFLFI